MLNKIPSNYKDCLGAKKGKQVLSVLANVAVIYILSTLLFTLVFKLIGDNLPSTKETLSAINLKEEEYHDERKKAGLLVYDKDNNLYDEKSVVNKLIINETKSALIHYNLEENYKYLSNYKAGEIVTKENLINNPVLYYFCSYKVENKAFYPENSVKDDYFYDFYKNKLVLEDDFILYNLDNKDNEIHYFTKENTLILADYYFKEDKYEASISLKNKVLKIYDDSYNLALKDFNDNNKQSKFLLDEYKVMHDKYANSLILEIFLSYLLSTILVYIVPYLIKKDYESLGSLFLKVPIVTKSGNKINIFHELGLFLINFISNAFVLLFVIFTVYGKPGLAIHNVGVFSIGTFSIFSLVFALISLGFMLILKNHQYLDAFSLMLERKNIEISKVSEEVKEDGK